jgi:hypothetical protein
MPVTVKQLTINTKVSKVDTGAEPNNENTGGIASRVTKAEQEKIIKECLNRVREIIENEYKP